MKTIEIEIVSHCYSEELPHYADALAYQLSSFVLHRPKECRVTATVCYCPEDERTLRVLDWFRLLPERQALHPLHKVGFCTIIMPKDRLGRRSIGRNVAAKSSYADIVWFADVDQVYLDGCLDRLATMEWPMIPVVGEKEWQPVAMIFPKTIKIHRDWATGDVVAQTMGGVPRLLPIDQSLFVDKRYNRAIGGVQIVRGDFARRHGYLGEEIVGNSWVNSPRADGRMFGDFKDDLEYRRFCRDRGGIVGVDLLGLHRLRHSTTSYQAPHV